MTLPSFSVPAPFVHRHVVTDADIDPQGRANNVAILGWMQDAAVAHSDAVGWTWDDFVALGAFFVVRRHEVDYRAPALLGDTILCATWPCMLKAATAHRRHELIRASDGAVIARGFNVWAFVDAATGKPQRIPPNVAAAFDPATFLVEPDPGATWTAGRRR